MDGTEKFYYCLMKVMAMLQKKILLIFYTEQYAWVEKYVKNADKKCAGRDESVSFYQSIGFRSKKTGGVIIMRN
jgi:hypothetical protein